MLIKIAGLLSLQGQGFDRLIALLLLIALAALLFDTRAQAADGNSPSWVVAPYLWLPDIKGSVTFSGTTIPLDVSARELAGGLNAGALGYGQWRRDDDFLYAEALGFSFKDDNFEPVDGLDIKASLLFAESGYGHTFNLRVPLPTDGVLSLSPYAGLRYAQLDATASTPKSSLIQRSMSSRNHWIDPALGFIAEAPLMGHLGVTTKADLSGGLDHDHYWNAIGVLRWYFTPDLSVGAGYRVTRFNADPHGSNDLRLRLRGSGPEAGLAYAF